MNLTPEEATEVRVILDEFSSTVPYNEVGNCNWCEGNVTELHDTSCIWYRANVIFPTIRQKHEYDRSSH
jgi:hypothetical protein